jgi:hypothetical protein
VVVHPLKDGSAGGSLVSVTLHVTLEYSANIRAEGKLPGLCRDLASTQAAQRDGV